MSAQRHDSVFHADFDLVWQDARASLELGENFFLDLFAGISFTRSSSDRRRSKTQCTFSASLTAVNGVGFPRSTRAAARRASSTLSWRSRTSVWPVWTGVGNALASLRAYSQLGRKP